MMNDEKSLRPCAECGGKGFISFSEQVAEPADPPQQQTRDEKLASLAMHLLDILSPTSQYVKAGTQMEGRKPVTIINFVRDMIDRAENAHESKPGICVEIPVFMADIARIKQSLRNDVSESANREPQASQIVDPLAPTLRSILLWCGATDPDDQFKQNGLKAMLDMYAKAKSERELQELRAEHEQLTAFSLLQKECVIAAEEMYGTCLGAYPNSSDTARTEACRKFLQLNDAVGRHPLDDKFLGMTDWKDIAASLRGLVGRMLYWMNGKAINYGDRIYCTVCFAESLKNLDLRHLPTCLISEAEAAIKEPHNER